MKFILILLIFIANYCNALPVIDDIVKFGHKINNNQAIEMLALQIMPMSTRVKLMSFVKDLYENLEDDKNAENSKKVVSFYHDEENPLSSNVYNKITDKLNMLKNQVIKNDKAGGFHEYSNES